MKKIAFFLALLLTVPCFSSCHASLKRYSETYTDVFDTVSEFVAYCRSEEEFQTVSCRVHEELKRLHTVFDIYHESEETVGVFALNQKAGVEALTVDADLYALLELGKEYYRYSDGKLNIAMGSVLSLWHEAREKADALPSESALQEASRHTDIQSLVLENGTAFLSDAQMRIDLGAVAKGYAAERAAQVAASLGLTAFSLNLGGNIVTYGAKPDTGNWTIGIQNPNGGLFTTVSVCDMAVVTSGDYQRYFEMDGVRYSHIIDPDTLFPACLYRSVTVLHPSSALADALSTALFCMEQEKGEELANRLGAEVLWIYTNGEYEKTEGFSAYEK